MAVAALVIFAVSVGAFRSYNNPVVARKVAPVHAIDPAIAAAVGVVAVAGTAYAIVELKKPKIAVPAPPTLPLDVEDFPEVAEELPKVAEELSEVVEEAVPEEIVAPPEVIKACWSGDAFGTEKWPTKPSPPRVAVKFQRVAWSGPIFSSPARARAPTIPEDPTKAARMELVAQALEDIVRVPPPPMPRTAWSGSPFEAPARPKAPRNVPAIQRAFSKLFNNPFKSKKKAATTKSTTTNASTANLGPPSPPSPQSWREACDSSGVVSWYDFGIRLV